MISALQFSRAGILDRARDRTLARDRSGNRAPVGVRIQSPSNQANQAITITSTIKSTISLLIIRAYSRATLSA
jgi:hypothetical protein